MSKLITAPRGKQLCKVTGKLSSYNPGEIAMFDADRAEVLRQSSQVVFVEHQHEADGPVWVVIKENPKTENDAAQMAAARKLSAATRQRHRLNEARKFLATITSDDGEAKLEAALLDGKASGLAADAGFVTSDQAIADMLASLKQEHAAALKRNAELRSAATVASPPEAKANTPAPSIEAEPLTLASDSTTEETVDVKPKSKRKQRGK